MLHIPVLRAGIPYKSLNTLTITDFRTGQPMAEMSLANPGLIGRDMMHARDHQEELERYTIDELIAVCENAADIFLNDHLPLGDTMQGPDDYLDSITASTGTPKSSARRNMDKIAAAMQQSRTVLDGLTRGLRLDELSQMFRRETASLGAILPNNSPGVHSLWIPSIPLRTPLILKPGSREPWSPYRIAAALTKAGMPPEGISIYPTDPNGTREILMRAGKSMFFGDKSTVEAWKGEDKIQLHGPGWSKVLLGSDMSSRYADYLDLMVTSIAANGGRSCINASGVWTSADGREMAEALAERLAAIPARGMEDPEAILSAFTNPKLAHMVSRQIDSYLAQGGAEDLTAKYREGDRVVELEGCTFLLPTLIWCDEPDHPLARAEYLFPYASVVQVPQDRMAQAIDLTLVATLLSRDEQLIRDLQDSTFVDRLNVGPIPTVKIRWDQPHEGNLFELLYKQRAVQFAAF
ncbi:MAG: aldehyde dehydrogenase family protein [Acidobacteriota bacterium]|nr:aldehyde dehydrogenase family protein [Acidobacteriota bacterium]